ncbi:ATP-dependent DNA helicase UvrD2 [Catenulispora pinisilvae]|uniref:ATP-dependent DNA helicase UvrD2 n=2 Tax=Catenulispora TaxID=414878 RepID=UPI001890EF9A|nr:ATP-dependent DNA helicase UvrD2 [Catenulispora pinisilvae]
MAQTPPGSGPVAAGGLLEQLDPEQRAVAEALHGPVCVLAGAGTGKTRAITYRIAYGVATGEYIPSQVLAVTFTQRAAGEMRGRLRQLGAGGVQARTFHAAALRQLQYFWPKAVGGPNPQLIDSKIPLVSEAVRRLRLHAERAELRDLAGEIEWAKSTQVVADDYAGAAAKALRTPPRDAAEVAKVYAEYESAKRDRNAIDFEDVLLLTIGIMEDRPDIAATVRNQYRYFTVDEYQDVNPLQQRLLDCWLGERADVCVVGDASQTIYSFTGADPRYLLDFADRFDDPTMVKLVRDYRSTPQVVALANALLDRAEGRAAKARVQLIAQRADGPRPKFAEHPDAETEAREVAREIKKLVDAGVRLSEIAVLYRINAQSEEYEQAFSDVGVPYILRGVERFFERPEVREAIQVWLRGAAKARSDNASDALPGLGAGGPGKDEGEAEGESLASEVRAIFSSHGWTPLAPKGAGRLRDRWESLAALVSLAEEYGRTHPDAGLDRFSAELRERADAQHAPTVEGVTLSTFHAAKGLEWDAVFLVGMTEGMMPITYAETPEQIEEERRLLYVGVTRARERLFLSWALARSPGGRASRSPSRFLDGLRGGVGRDHREGAAGAVIRGGGAGRRRGSGSSADTEDRPRRIVEPITCRVCHRSLIDAAERKIGRCETCPSDLDPELFEALREWRSGQAKKQKLPAYCVFTDATLTAIGESCPATSAALTRIAGVGKAKADRYGEEVLGIIAGSQPGAGPPADTDTGR